MTLIFATNNDHKVQEIRNALDSHFEIISLKEAGIHQDIPEPHDTLEANATEKSRTIFNLKGIDCFSEDTGLEVEALQGEPGVKSARYADNEPGFADNIDKLLYKMKPQTNRNARFRTVISLIMNGDEHQFEGICKGAITHERTGTGGFGYDPVFIAEGATQTFGEMTMEEKKQYSHRAKALKKLTAWLKENQNPAQ
ncbi:RdgB/HAM1 family non-canonical purine NTP pyrophosphatase [Niabella hibiscisoli]|uniref:RdgB/HAM1 family non-canonical purine NTP pyrophosphatase n=1 Tax=Niabella hibiscisoli TaxID=1825928 RepID=UPI001F0F739E|nr:RdgB/HAM1 family non-canonical purine NTP pyrophosphatase [Niabella hibiscisoli]MCH5718103.1 RdgB/HAM1 family non-canonical purine NTP pyrophosphatase [Niabella hibiscisoli]